MKITLNRRRQNKDSTVGQIAIDRGASLCVTLEDGFRDPKVPGETRIPAGEYIITFRTEGANHAKYLERFGPDFHKGMIHLIGVPNYKYVLIHCGNTPKDTEGCILVGIGVKEPTSPDAPFTISGSQTAYKIVYPIIREALEAGEKVTIAVIDPP